MHCTVVVVGAPSGLLRCNSFSTFQYVFDHVVLITVTPRVIPLRPIAGSLNRLSRKCSWQTAREKVSQHRCHPTPRSQPISKHALGRNSKDFFFCKCIDPQPSICSPLSRVVPLSLLSVRAMGGRTSNKGKGKGGEKQESKYVKKVDLYKFLGKWLLRSYPDGHGKPLMLGQKTAAQALAPEALRGTRVILANVFTSDYWERFVSKSLIVLW